jgi:hypothetical protein
MNSNSIKLTIFLAISVVILLFSVRAYADGDVPEAARSSDRLFTESSIITGFGTSDIAEGDYQPVLLIWHLGVDLKRFFAVLEKLRGSLSFYLEPQINPVVNPESDIECGIGLGFEYMYPFTDKFSLYIMGGIGPHYISVVTRDQANRFIFSDTAGAGLYYFITKDSAINLGYRFRHMSNAGLEHPNAGIETHFGTIGYSIFF